VIIIPNISQQEILSIRRNFEVKASKLGVHEKRSHYLAGDFVGYYYPVFIGDRKFIVAPSRIFIEIIENVLILAVKEHPDCFGKYNAYSVLKALYDINPDPMFNLDSFGNFLSRDKVAYIFEVEDGEVIGDALRMELFRKIDIEKRDSRKSVFTGGVFHAFKHFSYSDIPLSTQPTKNNLMHPRDIIDVTINAFFISKRTTVNHQRNIKISDQSYTLYNNQRLHSIFYYEENTMQYFINSIHPT